MHAYAFTLTAVYIISLLVSVALTCTWLLRPGRSVVSHVLPVYQFSISAGLFFRLMEWYAPDQNTMYLFIAADFAALSVALFLLAQVLFMAISRRRLPTLIQMSSGAGAVIVFFLLLSFMSRIRDAYASQSNDLLFSIYLFFPWILFLMSLVMIGWLTRMKQVNPRYLSFDRVMSVLPDTIFVLDRDGQIVDRNQGEPLLSSCDSREQLIASLKHHGRGSCKDLIKALQQPGHRVSGEIKWTNTDQTVRIYAWRYTAIENQHGRFAGSLLIFTDMTEIRRSVQLLQEQNDELRSINRRLSNTRDLANRYAGAATEQEVATIIDSSIRHRLEQARDRLNEILAKTSDRTTEQVQAVLQECRLALSEIRTLVNRLTS